MSRRKNVSKGKGRSAARDTLHHTLHHTLRLSALAGALGAGLGVDVPAAVAADPTARPGARTVIPKAPEPGLTQQPRVIQPMINPSPGLSPQIKLERRTLGESVQGKDWAPGGAVQMKATGDSVQQRVAPATQMKKGPAGALQMKVDKAMGVLPSGASKGIEAQSFKPGLLKDSLSLYSRKGQRLEARYTNEGYELYDLSSGKDARAADGSYRLQGGGRIEVKNGYVIEADELAIQRSTIAGIQMAFP